MKIWHLETSGRQRCIASIASFPLQPRCVPMTNVNSRYFSALPLGIELITIHSKHCRLWGIQQGIATDMRNSSSSSKPYSCVICHKRKVRCDRREPCSNCAKASAECIYLPPPPPRRRKRGRDANESGSQENEQPIRRTSGDSLLHRPETQDSTLSESPVAVPVLQLSGTGKLIRKEGNSVYIDK